ncbi:hypothetical protein [Nocardioides sp.]|uniref:hypothetical protein n=1 Tax=Nocardioides sp. TaxID=35761 RepID=UPI002C78FC69|nr:hypothetical protein [Nocardioides sp.]HXH79241.1 hypothetical protein [Nocardioides sp.]
MTPEPPSTPDDADRPAPYAPYAPYGRPQPFEEVDRVPVGPVISGGAPSYGTGPSVVMHPSATTAMVLGVVSLGGIFLCGLPLLLSPLAWLLGQRTLKQIDADPLRFSGRERAYTGRTMGMTGTVLLLLGIVFIVGADSGSDDGDDDGTGSTSYRYDF